MYVATHARRRCAEQRIGNSLDGVRQGGPSPFIEQAVDEQVLLPLHLPAARRLVEAAHLDVLVFADTTSEPLAWCLSLGRMAPVQVAFWGNPSTTGHGDTLDYFMSGDVMEVRLGHALQARAHVTDCDCLVLVAGR